MKPAIVFASLLVSAVLPVSYAHAQCERGDAVTTPIVFVGEDRVPVVTGTVNQQPFRFKLNTGTAVTTLNRSAVEKLGLSVRTSTTNYAGVDVQTVVTDKVAVGAVGRTGEFVVLDTPSHLYDGKVGATMLLRNDLELAFADGYMKQNSPRGCIRTFLAEDPKAAVVPFTIHPNSNDLRPWFWVTVNGVRVSATIATNHDHTMIDAKTAARMGLTHEMPGAVAEGEAKGWYDKMHQVSKVQADVTIGSYAVKNANVRIFDMDLTGEAMFLGADFLRANRVLISMGQHKIYITPLKDVMFAD